MITKIEHLTTAKRYAFEVPFVETISGENVLTWPHLVKHVDCYAVTEKEAESVTSNFKFHSIGAPFHGVAFWFDVKFGGPPNNNPAFITIEESTETKPSGSYRRKRANPDDALVLSTAGSSYTLATGVFVLHSLSSLLPSSSFSCENSPVNSFIKTVARL